MTVRKVDIAFILIICLLLTPVFTFADDTQTITDEAQASAAVTAVISESYSLMLPKSITLSKANYNEYIGDYSIKLTKADFDEGCEIEITSDDFYISNGTKNYLVLNDMDKTTTENDHFITLADTATTYNGKLLCNSNIPAGSYSGVVTFNISIHCDGAFDAEENLLFKLIAENFDWNTSFPYLAYQDERSKIANMIIPNGVTKIRNNTFWECMSLKKMTLPSSLQNVEDCAFQWCGRVEEVTFRGVTYTTVMDLWQALRDAGVQVLENANSQDARKRDIYPDFIANSFGLSN